jgi:hypothetical protein
MKHLPEYNQYYSKWGNKWVTPKVPLTDGDIIALKKYHYKLRLVVKDGDRFKIGHSIYKIDIG